MDNSPLFVCFSREALSRPSGPPAFHDEIADFARQIDRTRLREFFEHRFRWHWYPIVSSGMASFPVHGDLAMELSRSQSRECIGFAAEICAEEDGQRFISALGLLSLLCRGCDPPAVVDLLTRNFMPIRSKVPSNAIDPNIPYWFGRVAAYQLATGAVPIGFDGTFDLRGLNPPGKASDKDRSRPLGRGSPTDAH